MSFVSAVREGLIRAIRAPGLVALLWGVNLLAALPFAVVLGASIHDDVASRPAAHRLESGFDVDWAGELDAGALGFEASFGPEIVGAGAFLRNLEAWWSGRLFTDPAGGWGLLAAGTVFALVWIFLLGGVLHRLAQPRERSSVTLRPGGAGGARGGFGAACGRFFFRFLRLAVLSAPLYLLIFWGARRGFGILEDALRDVTSERTALLGTVLGALLVVLALTLVKVVFDYAKIAVVLEGRRSALGAAWAGARLVASRPLAAVGLYWSFALLALLGLWLYGVVAPQAGPATWPAVLGALVLGQLALALRLGLRVATFGAETALFGSMRSGSRFR
ncbi:MAG: hypothetical protein R3234_07640 [Thermoanaerobaculia bacterium]|nr:hypothetical protein [Thermoanaerobaculia bacterium]